MKLIETGALGTVLEMSGGWWTVQWDESGLVADYWAPLTSGLMEVVR